MLLSAIVNKLPRSSRRIVALDWDDLAFKAVEATLTKTALRVNRVISAAIPEGVKTGEPESFGAFIRQVLTQKRFSTRQVLMAIPRDKVILVPLRLPTASVGDLSNMVRLQASRELPFSADEAVMDFAGAAAHDAPEFVDVTVAAIQKDVMSQYQELARAAGLHLLRVELRPNASLLALTRGAHPFSDDRILFVDAGPQATEINIFRWGRLTFSRSVSVNIEVHGPVGDATGRPLLMEVLRTVEAYRATDPNRIDQVVIAGDTGLEGWLAEALRARLNTVASLYDPTWTIDIEADRAAQMAGFAAVLGLLAGETAPDIARFNFHVPKRPADVAAVRRKQAISIGSAAAVLIAGIWLSSATYLGGLEKQKAALATGNALLRKQANAADAIGKRVTTATKWIQQDMVWLDKLREVVDTMPENQRSYATKLTAKASSGAVADAREVQMGLRMNDPQVRKALQDGLKTNYSVILGPWRQTSDPKYGYTGDVNIVILPEKPKAAGKAAAPAAGGPASRPASDHEPEGTAPAGVPLTGRAAR